MGLHLLQSHPPFRIIKQGIDPYTISPSPRLPPCQREDHPVVESAQNLPNVGCHHPCLLPVYHDQLNHLQVNLDQGTGVCTLPAQQPSKLHPLMMCSLKVSDHCWTVAVRYSDNSTQIIEGGDRGKGNPISCDCGLFPRPCLLLRQAMSLNFLSPSSKGQHEVPSIEGIV